MKKCRREMKKVYIHQSNSTGTRALAGEEGEDDRKRKRRGGEKKSERTNSKEEEERRVEEKAYPCANDVKDTDVILNDSWLPISNRPFNKILERIEISHKSHLPLFFLLFALPLLLLFSSSSSLMMEW